MAVRLEKYSYRFAEQIFNGRLAIKNELENIIFQACDDPAVLGRPVFNQVLKKLFIDCAWDSQTRVSPGRN